ncbi:hypothetical protein [Calothrix sp. NIES-2098]|uniref:hypothetical protein n=1 Tax=Calothrix sp. NIES-2098 TaxID=1954171 RepID=UPI000B5EE709|nr:hypothetical protein NIES2098_38200 [Calothrix sp. NIES-2098]
MKKAFITLLVTLLVGCSANARTQQKSSTSGNETIDFPKALALRDGKTQPAQVAVYREEFEKFKKLCVESRADLAGMVYSIAKKGKAAGYKWSTNLDTLKSFALSAESFDRKPGRCFQVYQTYLESLQEESRESSK